MHVVAIGGEHAGWIKNVRANPAVEIRIRGGRFRGKARNLRYEERAQAEALYTSFTGPFEYLESLAHLSGMPRRRRIQKMHRHWFHSGLPLAIDIGVE